MNLLFFIQLTVLLESYSTSNSSLFVLNMKNCNQIKTMNRRDVDSNVEEYHPKGHTD